MAVNSKVTSSLEDPRSKRGGHRLFDHSSFPDAVILRVRDKNFMISASYLALHSPYFHNLFYGPKTNGLNGRYELDFDPHTFGDLLDIIYPCYKKTSCCVECSNSFNDRLTLAIQLQLKFAIKRLIVDNPQHYFVTPVLKNNNLLDRYSYLTDRGDSVRKYATSDSLDQLSVSASFPDAVTVIVKGITILVSASTLSLHSEILANTIYKDGQVVEGAKFDVDTQSFISFLQSTTGDFPSNCSSKFLNDLLILGAKPFYDFYLSAIRKEIVISIESGDCYGIPLLEHYSSQPNPNINDMGNLARFISQDQLDPFISNCSLSQSDQEALRNYTDNEFQMFVKNLKGRTITYVVRCNDTTEMLMAKIEIEEGISADSQRLIFGGTQLETGRTLSAYRIVRDSTVHLTLRLKGC